MRYILKAESYARRGASRKLYCIIARSAVFNKHVKLAELYESAKNWAFVFILLLRVQW
jgi:hypothetical protein